MKNNKYTYEIKRENGDKIIIEIEYSNYTGSLKICWIGILPKRKRNVKYIVFDDYSYRSLDMDGRKKCEAQRYLEIVTLEEFQEAFTKAWESIKPVINVESDLYNMV